MDEINKLKARYAQQIEDGRKTEAFTTMPEYVWYVEHVIEPTIEEYTHKIISGDIPTDKEDWIIRGMILGMKLMTDTPLGFQETAKTAKKLAKSFAKYEKTIEDERY